MIKLPNCPLDVYSSEEPISYDQKSNAFLFVGRVDDAAKGFDVLINAWISVHEKIPSWKLLITGMLSSENKVKWEKLLNDGNLRESVEWLGYLETESTFGILSIN